MIRANSEKAYPIRRRPGRISLGEKSSQPLVISGYSSSGFALLHLPEMVLIDPKKESAKHILKIGV